MNPTTTMRENAMYGNVTCVVCPNAILDMLTETETCYAPKPPPPLTKKTNTKLLVLSILSTHNMDRSKIHKQLQKATLGGNR